MSEIEVVSGRAPRGGLSADPQTGLPPALRCSPLFFGIGIEEYQWLDPDLFQSRARASARHSLGHGARRPAARPLVKHQPNIDAAVIPDRGCGRLFLISSQQFA
jgi:hypothetical protein